MPGWSPSGWSRDEQNGLILFRIPKEVSLVPSTKAPKSTTPILHLPLELHHSIAGHLHPVDRVCLGLTCKTLTLSLLSAPRLCPTNWARFSDRGYEWIAPESFSLILRLAHGWVPKALLRYCWKCHKILPRDESYFRQRMACKATPKWSLKVGLSQAEWAGLPRRKRYDHILHNWCHTKTEDSSGLYCEYCQHIRRGPTYEGAPPVECPVCLEKELTWVWPTSRRRRWGRKVWKAVQIVLKPLLEVLKWIAVAVCSIFWAMSWVIEQIVDLIKALKK